MWQILLSTYCMSLYSTVSMSLHSSRLAGVSDNYFYFCKQTCCGHSFKVPQWGTFNEYPQHMFACRNKMYIFLDWKKASYLELWLCKWTVNSPDQSQQADQGLSSQDMPKRSIFAWHGMYTSVSKINPSEPLYKGFDKFYNCWVELPLYVDISSSSSLTSVNLRIFPSCLGTWVLLWYAL